LIKGETEKGALFSEAFDLFAKALFLYLKIFFFDLPKSYYGPPYVIEWELRIEEEPVCKFEPLKRPTGWAPPPIPRSFEWVKSM
jgi:hypothetical protein